jgi:hypothetical protein
MRGKRGLLFAAIALIIAGLLVLYFTRYYGREAEQKPTAREAGERAVTEGQEGPQQGEPVTTAEKTEEITEEEPERKATEVEDECKRMENELVEFLNYLDKKDYVRKLGTGEDMFTRFKRMALHLSSSPPTPAGEGLKPDTIIRNIYHFYRVLGIQDLKLIKMVLMNEADTLEINLAVLYQWLMSAERCGQKDGLPPSLDVVYRYSGFLINSIGGRAYLFRRQTRLRLLMSYYCLLVIHEADKKRINRFGIDIAPFLEPLAEEIENNQSLYYRKEYAGRLIALKNYYVSKRKAS